MAAAWRSPRVASRRSRSMARWRAVVMIQPAGRGRYAVDWPVFQRRGERVLHRLFGQRNVAQRAHQHRHRAAILAAEHCFDVALLWRAAQ
jgi:hypothetical protein